MIHPPDQPTVLSEGGDNAIAYLVGVAADEWTLLILRHALHGVDRVQRWLDLLPIPPEVLVGRLRRMTDHGILTRSGDRYRLGRRGAALWPVVVAIASWEARWGDGRGGVRHRVCDQAVDPVLRCHDCGLEVAPRDLAGEHGPSGSWPRSTPSIATRRQAGGSADLGPGFFPHARTLVGNRWSAALLGAVYFGATRFGEFLRQVGAPATVVIDRLRVFGELGVLRVDGDFDRVDMVSFDLTDKGRAFFPAVATGVAWGHRWFVAPEGPAVVLRHDDHEFRPLLCCTACDQVLAAREIEVTGP